VLAALEQNHPAYVDFMMRFELGLEKPAANRAHRSALTIAASYIAGGIIPLLPYMFVRAPYMLNGGDILISPLIQSTAAALKLSVLITLLALGFFGAIKGRLVGTGALRSALQTSLIGGAAAAAAYALAHLLNRG
jgi:VIT1/CCC1 family predicted Fe2+/Mn2+ transporter